MFSVARRVLSREAKQRDYAIAYACDSALKALPSWFTRRSRDLLTAYGTDLKMPGGFQYDEDERRLSMWSEKHRGDGVSRKWLGLDPCVWCFQFPGRADRTIEHVIPISAGGGHVENKAMACRRCNGARGETPLLAFLLKRHSAKQHWPSAGQRRRLAKKNERRRLRLGIQPHCTMR